MAQKLLYYLWVFATLEQKGGISVAQVVKPDMGQLELGKPTFKATQ